MRSAVIGLPPYRIFSLEELEEATNYFDAASLLCEQLYRGCLREGIAVTVKCIKLKQKSLPKSLAQQMEVLSKLRHMHLVSVLGHCIANNQEHNQHAGNTIFIVQEYISNGSLRDFLTGNNNQFGVILLQIITGKIVAPRSSEMGSLKLQLENGLRDDPSELSSLADPSVKGSYAYESLRTTVEFAINCLCEDPSKRPSIEDVVWNLQYTIQVQQGWRTSSGNHESSMKAIYE